MTIIRRLRYALPLAALAAAAALTSCGQLTRCHPVKIGGETVCTTLTRAEP